jgi:hypothetical protein
LSGEDYLFVPKTLIPLAGTTFLDSSASKYQPFKNTFRAAALPQDGVEMQPEILESRAG